MLNFYPAEDNFLKFPQLAHHVTVLLLTIPFNYKVLCKTWIFKATSLYKLRLYCVGRWNSVRMHTQQLHNAHTCN